MIPLSPPPAAISLPPAAFVAEQGPRGDSLRSQLILRSARTGAVQRTLGTFGLAFTNNGLAVTQDLGTVFYTLAPARRGAGLRVMRLDTNTGQRSLVAAGSEPALSPDDGQLAYGGVPQGLSVRTRASRITRTLSLTHLLGASADLTLTSLSWLGDGDDVVVVAPPQFVADAGPPPSRARAGSCHPASRPVLVFVHVPPAPAALSAHCVTVPNLDPAAAITASSPSQPDTARVASLSKAGFTVRDVAPNGTVTRVLTVAHGLPLAFDPAGDRLLYLRGSRPPALWSAQVRAGRLVAQRELIADSQLGAAAW